MIQQLALQGVLCAAHAPAQQDVPDLLACDLLHPMPRGLNWIDVVLRQPAE
jgi:hypothetical protein